MRIVNIVFELTSFFFWNSLLTEVLKPCTLNLTNMLKNIEQRENKEVSRRMSHCKHRITYIRQGAYPKGEHSKGASLVYATALPANIRLGWKSLSGQIL